jgi:hypothetical protein
VFQIAQAQARSAFYPGPWSSIWKPQRTIPLRSVRPVWDIRAAGRSRSMQISASAGQRGSLEAAPTTDACDGVCSSRLGCSRWQPPSCMDSSDHDDPDGRDTIAERATGDASPR